MNIKDMIIRLVYGRKEAEGAAYEPIAEETYSFSDRKAEENANENTKEG